MFTVKELLKDCCPELVVLNQNADLSRRVFSADITETPDISDYISKDTLIITTGMAFKESPEKLSELIIKLNEKPAPGLAIKLGRFIKEIPQNVIELADFLEFPILLIPEERTLGEISHTILSYIWNSQAKMLSWALDTNREFSSFVHKNAPVASLILDLSKMLDRSILFITPFLDISTQSISGEIDAQVVQRTIRTIRSHYLDKRNLGKRSQLSISRENKEPLSVTILPVKVDSYQNYLLAVFGASELPFPFSELVLEQVTIPLAFVQYKYQILAQTYLNEKEKFFRLVSNAQNNPETFPLLLATYDSWYGLKSSDFYQAVVVGVDNLSEYEESAQVQSIVYRWLAQEIPKRFEDACVFSIHEEGHFAIILQRAPTNLQEELLHLSNQLNQYFPFALSFAIGNIVDSLDSLWFSYLKAAEVHEEAVEENDRRFIKEYFAQGINDFIPFFPPGHAEHFAKYTLKELTYPKDKLNQELRQTLGAYMDSQGDLTKTAKLLYIHRNTVRYRIEKVEEILGVSLSDPDASLNVRMALLITKE